MSQIKEEYILVPKASLSARNAVSETSSAAVVAAPEAKEAKEKASSAYTQAKLGSMMFSSSKDPDAMCETTLTAVYGDYIPSAAFLDYKINLYTDLCLEWPNFKQVFEQYRVKKIEAITWTGELVDRFQNSTSAANCNGMAIASSFTRQPLTAAVTFVDLCDMPAMKLLEYGTTRNAFKQTFKPDGCFTADTGSSPTSFIHQKGWMETNNANQHIWATFAQNSEQAAINGTTKLVHIYRFYVEFRRRRYQAA